MKRNSARQRLRELYLEATRKRGAKRTTMDVQQCFLPFCKWLLERWHASEVALAIDASSLGERFVVLAVSIVYRGIAIPVSWTVLHANQTGSWNVHWIRMLRGLRPAIAPTHRVIVVADRGIYSPLLFREVHKMCFHPFFRINVGGNFRPEGAPDWRPLKSFVPTVGATWCGEGTAFKASGSRLQSTPPWHAGSKAMSTPG
ncbi:MAG: hypothetical protein HYV63_05380 [Candidatus Schekmanbacteria bacterium]|nr:hypothetical protein [Candidatus Schekmanbacteria bacterium]